MPFVERQGRRIHYEVEGAGPLVVLQHGAIADAEFWKHNDFSAGLSPAFRVARVDSMGHGASDKPDDASAYTQQSRAADIVAVIDALGEPQAHMVGYSMGGWIGVGVAKFFPSRLASLVVGGWDVQGGLETARLASGLQVLDGDIIVQMAKASIPGLAASLSAETEQAWRLATDALADSSGATEAVINLPAPVLLWSAQVDPHQAAMEQFASDHGLPYFKTAGDHVTAFDSGEALIGVRSFLERITKK